MYPCFKNNEAVANRSEAMETRNHFKNEAAEAIYITYFGLFRFWSQQ